MNTAEKKTELANPETLASGQVLSMIERASKDPAIDVEKIERMMALYERTESRRAEAEFNAAMASCQAELAPIIAKNRNEQTKSRYAKYWQIDAVIRPVYIKHGFTLSFDTAPPPSPDYIRVVCHVSHSGGFTRTYQIDMPADGKGPQGGAVMTRTHATGSGTSYGKRYLVVMIFNLAIISADDDDGNAAGMDSLADQEATKEIYDKIDMSETADELRRLKDAVISIEGVSRKGKTNLIAYYNGRLKKLKATQ